MSTTGTFDYHWDGLLVWDETPSGTDLGTFDWHWDGEIGVPEEAGGVVVTPFALIDRRPKMLLDSIIGR